MPLPRVSLRVSAVPVLSLALAHNRVGVLGDLRITSGGPPVQGAELRVTVTADPASADGTGPTVLGSATVAIDLPAHGAAAVPAIPSPLDPTALSGLTDPAPGQVRIEVLVDGQVAAAQHCAVQVLGADQWAAVPVTLALETLASFVRPQDPVLDDLLSGAGPDPLANTGRDPGARSGSVSAYLDGPDRVDQRVRALAEAVHARGIRLLDPDPGWPDHPQRIRGAGEVLADGAASALEAALLLASALERGGLHPLVWITGDGPIVGYWREDNSLPAAAVTDVDGVVNLLDLGLLGGLDPTLLTDGATEAGFDAAVAACRPRLHGDLSGVLGVLDVRAARRDGIAALPVSVPAADGTSRVVEYVPPQRLSSKSAVTQPSSKRPTGIGAGAFDGGASDGGRGRSRRDATATAGTPPPVPARVAQWKNALLDLSLRNRLLNYTGRGAVNLAVPPGMLAAMEDTIHGGGTIALLPSDQVSEVQQRRGVRAGRDLTEEQRAELLTTRHAAYTDLPTDGYVSRLRSLAYRARTIVEETGANHLYLALGTMVWNLDGRDLRSPVVLIPVTLAPRTRRAVYRIELDEAGTSTPNYCLLEKLRQVHGVTVPGLTEPVQDSAGIDLDAAFRALRSALAAAGLNYRVEQTADLALLAFAKFRLWKDLDEHWADLARNPLVDHLISSPTTLFTDPVTASDEPADLDALATRLPISADASQLEAVDAAATGHTFVLEGPPGTGKSQTITNMLAHAISEGRRVLFVAEKRAALDVVTRRLEAIGLAPFCLDLHDKGAKPSVVRAQIRAALELRVAADEQGLAAAGERVRSSAAQLERYAKRLHQPNAAGLSYYSAHTQSLAVGDGPALPIPHGAVAATDIDLAAARTALIMLPDVADPAGPRPDHPWGFVDPPDPDAVDPAGLAAAAVEVDSALGGALDGGPVSTPEVITALSAARAPSDLSNLARLAGGYPVDIALLDEAATDHWRQQAAAALSEASRFASAAHPGLDVATPEVFSLPVDDIDAAAQRAAASSWFGRKKRQLAVLARLEPALRPGTAVPRKQLAELTSRLAGVWQQIVSLQVRLASVRGLTPPDGWNPLTRKGMRWLEERVEWLRWVSDTAALRDRTGRPLADLSAFRVAARQLLESRAVVGLDEREALGRLAAAFTELGRLSGGDTPYVARSGDGLVGAWRRTSGERRAAEAGQPGLRRYLALLAQLQPLRPAGLDRARALLLSGAIAAADAARAFDAGVAAASLAERAAATGLDGFEHSAHDRAVRRFVHASEHVREQLVSAIPARVLSSRTFETTSGFGQIGELSRELAKQRRGLAVRPLLERYGDLVTAVMPCMLVSPDSLARFFPPQPNLFDLVVFDEASQIRVADAIGALGRAKAAVVVGDSQQMPPTSVAESTADPVLAGSSPGGDIGEAAGDLLSVPDEESILSECVQAGVPRRWLSWHYRSQDEALIAFSNRRYYEDRLSTFPSPVHGRADPGVFGHGVSLIRVDGHFLRSNAGKRLRTNPVEAEAVVTEIQRRFDAEPDGVPSIGVVTFNAPQRTLIESMLRVLDDERISDALDHADGEGLFVKNLENVQGDERDVILFSTAFSTNDRGVLPLNFGPLNQIGGQRRLNVAVTRARRQVLVFSSFDPEDLRAGETSSQGIKDLRDYLEVAASGAGTVIGSSPRAPAPDRHRDEIAAAMASRGLSVTTNVGLSDFTLDLAVGIDGHGAADGDGVAFGDGEADDPGDVDGPHAESGPRVAVLLDGPEWAGRRTVGDRDGLPVQVLSSLMRWPAVRRVWLPEWLRDKDSVLDELEAAVRSPQDVTVAQRDAVDTERRDGSEGTDHPTGTDGTPVEVPGVDANQQSEAYSKAREISPEDPSPTPMGPPPDHGTSDETPFTPWISGYLGSRDVLDRLPAPRAVEQVRRALLAGIEAEGPIHVDRLAKLVAGGFDLGRISMERRAAILECLPGTVFRDPADLDFAWPDERDPTTWTGFRRTGRDAHRPLEHICSREIGNAMLAICVAGAGDARNQLEIETLRVFDFHRRTAGALALLDRALGRAMAEGRVVNAGGVLRAAR